MSVWGRHAEGAGTIVVSRISKPHIPGDLVAVVVSAAVAIAIGAALAVNPLLALLPVAALAGILLLVDARAEFSSSSLAGFWRYKAPKASDPSSSCTWLGSS